MIDHLLSFADEATAQAAIAQYWIAADYEAPASWRGDVCIPDVGVYAVVGGERQYYAGWFIIIALTTLNLTLRDLPDHACRLIADREAAVAGSSSFLRYVAADMAPADLAVAQLDRIFVGSKYPFGTL